jgi:hypothetical protein
MVNSQTYVANKITAGPKMWTVKHIYDLFDGGKLISISEFLQRELLENLWKANDYLNSKQYIASIWKGSHMLDLFSLVELKKLIEIVEKNRNIERNYQILEEYEKLFLDLKKFETKGVQYVSLDGQSRLMLGIKWYMKNNFTLNGSGKDVDLIVDGKPSNCLITTTFDNLPKSARDLFNSITIPVVVVTNFSKLSDLVEALVNKQKGFTWSWFQIAKQSERFSIFAINLINQTPKDFKEKYKKALTKLSSDFKDDRDGHQLYLVVMAYFVQFGKFPSKEKIKQLFADNSGIISISNSAFELVIKYTNEYFRILGDTKSTLTPLINYVLYRQLMDAKKLDSDFVKSVVIPANYIIKNENEFGNYFIKNHHKLYNKKHKHDASFVTDTTGNKVLSKTGYHASCGKQDDENIYRRINIFIKYFDFDYLINNGIVEEIQNVNMPSQIDIAIYNNWEDVNGNVIEISDLSEMDRSHFDSKAEGGSNELKNLGLEHFTPNRSRGKKKLEKI